MLFDESLQKTKTSSKAFGRLEVFVKLNDAGEVSIDVKYVEFVYAESGYKSEQIPDIVTSELVFVALVGEDIETVGIVVSTMKFLCKLEVLV